MREGDFEDPASLERALAGVDRLLIISLPRVGERVPQHQAAVDAAAAAGVKHVLYTSITDPSDSNPAYVAAEHRATEERMRASGLAWTFLRNSIYTEMLVPTAQGALAGGTLLTNAGDGATSYVSRADCAAAAAAVLTSDGHEGKAYDITGPEAIGADAQAALFSELGGKPVTVTHVDDDAWVAAMVEHAGLPEPAARIYASSARPRGCGYSDTVSTTVEDLTGRAPRSARSVLEGLLGRAVDLIPDLGVRLGRPDHGVVRAVELVHHALDVEREAVLEDRPVAVGGGEVGVDGVEGRLQALRRGGRRRRRGRRPGTSGSARSRGRRRRRARPRRGRGRARGRRARRRCRAWTSASPRCARRPCRARPRTRRGRLRRGSARPGSQAAMSPAVCPRPSQCSSTVRSPRWRSSRRSNVIVGQVSPGTDSGSAASRGMRRNSDAQSCSPRSAIRSRVMRLETISAGSNALAPSTRTAW